jgi:hypothetical protein
MKKAPFCVKKKRNRTFLLLLLAAFELLKGSVELKEGFPSFLLIAGLSDHFVCHCSHTHIRFQSIEMHKCRSEPAPLA